MNNSELKENYLDENSFWHITNKLNIQSIIREGLVPRDGKRNGESKSDEDPVPRVFFSNGLEAVLEQANNLAFLISEFIKNIERRSNGDSGQDVKKRMQDFLNNSVNDDMTKKDAPNGGFIDIANFIRNEIFQNGINENLTEQDINRIIYDIAKTIWENSVCLRANLREGIDYSWDDVNYNSTGTKKVPMTKKNMHAFEGHTIIPDILEIITDENGKPRTTWDIFKEMAIFYKKEHPNKGYLPVEEWKTGFLDENGQLVYTGEMNHREDYLSMFIEMEKEEQAKESKKPITYYHYTKPEDLKSILEGGLDPDFGGGKVSKLIGDKRKVVCFSEGAEGLISLMCNYEYKYKREGFNSAFAGKSFEDVLNERIYLAFSSDEIDIRNESEDNEDIGHEWAFADGSTRQNISSNILKVCVLRNKKDGSVIYTGNDILNYMMLKNPVRNFSKGSPGHIKRREEYYGARQTEMMKMEDYELEYMDLDKFYQQFILRDTVIVEESSPPTVDENKYAQIYEKGKAVIGKTLNDLGTRQSNEKDNSSPQQDEH